MADQLNVSGAPLTYSQFTWGDCIRGTKEQLQALGLAVGRAFPGEPGGGGARSKLKTLDPHGFEVRIRKDLYQSGDDVFTADRYFPHWPERPAMCQAQPFAIGVRLERAPWWDEYVGTPADLIAAGVLTAEDLSAFTESGRRKLTIYADGTIETRRVPEYNKSRESGARRIQQKSRWAVAVQVLISNEEHDARFAADKKTEREWEQKVKAMPRPPRLMPVSDGALTQRQHAEATAARDTCFQGFLAKLVANASAGNHG
jgi:hypothetical protein